MNFSPLPPSFAATRDALQRVAVHIVARAREQATGRFGLRATTGGFGTPEFGDDLVRVRVSGGVLVRETGGTEGASTAARAIDGASLTDLAAHAQVDLGADLYVGHDTPPLGDTDESLSIDGAAAAVLGDWYAVVGAALDRAAAVLGEAASPSLVQLWPEHFDVAIDVAYDASAPTEKRANLGGSPGDGFHDEPYVYVGPWTADRPGDQTFWNAPFGAIVGYGTLAESDDPVGTIADFFVDGVRRLGAG